MANKVVQSPEARPNLKSRLRAFGVPAGAEIVGAGQDADGNLTEVRYRDRSGKIQILCADGNVADTN